ncbi:DNA (cytosine-5-)-methyltransferase [Galdieria sulphuraria]|uniref:DNA (cytosine-5-)-methyltransferase n=1 Tax=Galdieria sulphuraria TaxID=130081 RepID=M2XXW3_GALSU|nr:DNA (cytosine-5-)-methyltransferase [Galdieria sulphuraria]EME28279.1 DNA (cytosine-5-)-methyltransferase [Galdieria sulphuraria]|eukprot:XP_005704799.1 DNA (cytosine-5-)-methyltransferase [Galdieria sulphuraria]
MKTMMRLGNRIEKTTLIHLQVGNRSNISFRSIRNIGPDGSYYDCDSCAVPEGGWQKYWKDKQSKRRSTHKSASSDSFSESCCSDEENDWLGDTLICCEKCPITLHFACVCPPLNQNKLKDIWLCALCEQQNQSITKTHRDIPPLLLLSSFNKKHDSLDIIQTPSVNIQYQISSWNWFNDSFSLLYHCSDGNLKKESNHNHNHEHHSLKLIFSQLSQLVKDRNTTEFTPQMIVFSAFDGIAAARLALQRLGIVHVRYYASEIDSKAIRVAHTRFPDIISLGDIRQVSKRDIPEGVDFMIGGSPCQSLSRLGRQRGIQSGPSSLFFEYVRLLEELKPRYFLLENVASMNAQDRQIITDALGVEPILVDASRFSAGIRYRYYWTNIPNAKRIWTLEEKPNCYLQDILMDHARAQYPKAYTITTNNYAPRAFDNRFNTVWYNDQEKRGLNIIEAERILG